MSLWIVFPLVILLCVFILLTTPPTFIAEWVAQKLETHPKLEEETVTIDFNKKRVEGEDKREIIRHFNKAIYIERYGFHPEQSGTPIVITTKRGSRDVRYLVYNYNDHVDVFRQYKKKVIAYRLRSERLQCFDH